MKLVNGKVITSDPLKKDTDEDGLTDLEEMGRFKTEGSFSGSMQYKKWFPFYKSDPTLKDTDGDDIIDPIDARRLIPDDGPFIATTYSPQLVEFVKLKEGFSETVYNNGQTIAYGFDFKKYPNVQINYNPDGKTVSKQEGERLLKIVLNQSKWQIKRFLKEKNLTVDQNTFDALTDLYYNRNSNQLTEEVVIAMAMKDDNKVKSLLSDFDYRYAMEYLYDDNSQESKAYVDRNPGLKTRRDEEYSIYKNGFK